MENNQNTSRDEIIPKLLILHVPLLLLYTLPLWLGCVLSSCPSNKEDMGGVFLFILLIGVHIFYLVLNLFLGKKNERFQTALMLGIVFVFAYIFDMFSIVSEIF